jgi:hypothetical protein
VSTRYTHLELGKDVETGIAGHYTPQKEVRLKYNNKEALYVIGCAVVEASCCGGASWLYAIVPGFIINWQNAKDSTGQPVSEVEPVLDVEEQANLRHLIKEKEAISLVDFW